MSPQTNQTPKKAPQKQNPQTAPDQASQQASPQPANFKSSEPGAISKAWTDITGHRGWFPRVLLLMFMGAIPFMNFFVAGYLLKWATKTSNTDSQGLPRHTFDGEAFVWGFLFSILQLIATISVVFISIFFFMIPIIGFILSWLLSIFFSGYIYIAGIRMVQKKNFGSGFDLSQIFEVIKRDPWHLFFAILLPTLAVFAVIAVILAIVWGIFLAANMLNIFNLASSASRYGSSSLSGLGAYGSSSAIRGYGNYGYSYAQPDFWGIIFSIIAGGGVTVLISLLVASIIGAFGNIWVVRAVAHWLRKNAPEWFEGHDVPYVEKPIAPAAPEAPVPPAPRTASAGPANPASPAGKAPAAPAGNASQAAPATSKKSVEK